jgi:hypothetical protein
MKLACLRVSFCLRAFVAKKIMDRKVIATKTERREVPQRRKEEKIELLLLPFFVFLPVFVPSWQKKSWTEKLSPQRQKDAKCQKEEKKNIATKKQSR